jgi:hypothetical protein
MALDGQGHDGGTDLTMDALAPVLAAAIQHWADAGASASQIALLENTKLTIADLPDSGFLANTDANGITIDVNAAGWGWYVDPTPSNNSEYQTTAAPNDLFATSGSAVGPIDLLTVIEHELGHVLGLPDTSQDGVMNINLDTGERRLVTSSDVAQTSQSFVSDNGGQNFVFSEPHVPAPTTPTTTTPASSAQLAALHNADSFPAEWFAAGHFDPNAGGHGPSSTPSTDSHDIGGTLTFSSSSVFTSLSPTTPHVDVIIPDPHTVGTTTLPDPSHSATSHGGLLI